MNKRISKALLLLGFLVLVLSIGLAACSSTTPAPHVKTPTPFTQSVNGHPCNPQQYYMQCASKATGQILGSPLTPLTVSPFGFGIDFAWGGPSGWVARSLGAHFGISYLSFSSKDWTASRLASYKAAGLGVGFVWETSQYRALSGCGGGASDARSAAAELSRLGYAGAPVFFAVDFDTSGYSPYGVVGQYFHCAKSVLGSRTGVYGGYQTTQIARAQGIPYNRIWQTLAWTYGRWTAACLHQYNIDQNWHGYNVDYNLSRCADWGQFNPAPPPPPPDPYAYLDKTVRRFSNGVKASEYNTVKTWDKAKCANPVKRSVCKSSFYHLELLSGRVYYLATHADDGHTLKHARWSEPNKRQPWGSRFAAMHNRITS